MAIITLIFQWSAILYLVTFGPTITIYHLRSVIHDWKYTVDVLDIALSVSVCVLLALGFPAFNN